MKATKQFVSFAAILVSTVVLMLVPVPVRAGDTYWQVDNGNWATDAYWTAGEPTSLDDAYINNGGRSNLVYAGEVCDNLYVGYDTNSDNRLLIYNSGELTVTGYEVIGHSGTGSVSQSVGTNTCLSLLIGHYSGGSGSYSLSGTGQLSPTFLHIGKNGVGALSISGGADADCVSSNMGGDSPGIATVTIDGLGSSWTLTTQLNVGGDMIGNAGTGTVTIDNDGLLDVGTTANIFDDSSINVVDGQFIATDLQMFEGSQFNTNVNSTLDIGSASLSGAGTTWTHGSTLKVDSHSNSHTASINLDTGAALDCNYGWIGYNNGYTGSVTVSDTDSTWDVTNNLTVGYYGTGTLTLTNEAIVSCNSLDIGRKSSGNGTVTVGDWYPNSFAELQVNGNVNIGPEGTGLLDIVDRNRVEAGGTVTIHPGGTLNLEGGLLADELALLAGGTYQDLYGELWVNRLTGFGNSVNLDSIVHFGHSGGAGTHTVGLGQSFACNDLTVGFDSTAEFVIEHGGQVSTAFGHADIGDRAGADGTLTVRHSGSRLDTGVGLRVGYWGQGTLNVLDGGVVTAPDLLEIGHEGVGEVTVNDGTITVSNGPVFVGEGSASGTLTVSNGGLIEWNAAQALSIGANGVVNVSDSELSGGSIQVAGGGSFTSDGLSDLNVDSVTVTGAGSSWTHTSSLMIENGTVGSISLDDGATLTTNIGYIANGAGTTGSVTVSGLNTQWDAGSHLYVGRYGNGTMTIASGVTYTGADGPEVICDYGYIGRFSGSTSIVTVGDSSSNENSLWKLNNALSIGAGGTGTLALAGQGVVEVGGKVTVGAGGAVNFTDLGWLLADEVELSPGATFDGQGYLITNKMTGFGDTINFPNMNIYFGFATGSSAASHTVDAGQTFTANRILVGNQKAASVLVDNGGVLTAVRCDLMYPSTLTIDGDGIVDVGTSLIRYGATLNVTDGTFTAGSLDINNGADMNTNFNSALNIGTVLLEHTDTTWTHSSYLYIGSSSAYMTPTLTVSENAEVISTRGYIGGVNGHSGTVTVQTSASWDAGARLYVGFHGDGTLNINSGGEVSSVLGYIGYDSTSTSDVTVDGAGSIWTNSSDLYVGYSGTGELTIDNGGTVDVGGTLYVRSGGTATLNAGVLSADTINHTYGGNLNFNGGRLYVETFQGSLKNNGGTLCPGTSPAKATVTGNFLINSGSLEIELVGLLRGDDYDALVVSGELTLAGTLDVLLIDSFTPVLGNSFDILDWDTLSGTFGTVNLPRLSAGLDWDSSNLYTTGEIIVTGMCMCGDANNDGVVSADDYASVQGAFGNTGDVGIPGDANCDGLVSADDYASVQSNFGATSGLGDEMTVPEPATLSLLAIGGLAMMRRRKS